MTTGNNDAPAAASDLEAFCVADTAARLAEHLPYAIAILRAPDFKYEYINSHYQAIAPGKVILGRPFAEVWPELPENPLPILRRVLETGIPFHETGARYNLCRSPEAPPEPVLVSYSWVPLPVSAGARHLLAIGSETALPLAGSPDRAHRDDTVRHLAAGFAHDFNNLLTTMLGYACLGLASEPSGSRAASYFAAIRQSAETAAALTSQILSYSGQGRAFLSSVQLSEITAQAVRLLRPKIPNQIAVELELVEALPMIQADPRQIEQLLTNLILNSVEAIGDVPGAITIRTFAQDITDFRIRQEFVAFNLKPGFFVSLEVADTGHGIEPEILPHIFEPFFTTRFTGRGLGLAAVDGIVRACQGAVQVSSTPGRGACFRIFFPAFLLAGPAGTTGH